MTMKPTIANKGAICAAAVVAAGALFAATPPARAGPCGLREQLIKDLADTYKEKRVAMALTATGDLLEIFVSRGGTWTAVVSKPSGRACIVAAGETWISILGSLGTEV
jgi:hypothetical protein